MSNRQILSNYCFQLHLGKSHFVYTKLAQAKLMKLFKKQKHWCSTLSFLIIFLQQRTQLSIPQQPHTLTAACLDPCMTTRPSDRNRPSPPPLAASSATAPSDLQPKQLAAAEDTDLEELDDNELSDSETPADMALYRTQQQQVQQQQLQGDPMNGGGKKLSEVANAIASCSALSFFSISMILANKVR